MKHAVFYPQSGSRLEWSWEIHRSLNFAPRQPSINGMALMVLNFVRQWIWRRNIKENISQMPGRCVFPARPAIYESSFLSRLSKIHMPCSTLCGLWHPDFRSTTVQHQQPYISGVRTNDCECHLTMHSFPRSVPFSVPFPCLRRHNFGCSRSGLYYTKTQTCAPARP